MTTQTLEKQVQKETTPVERMRSGQTYSPQVDIYETRDELVLVADMPGVAVDDIDIQFENGELSIYGRVPPRYPEERDFLHAEYGTGDFQRTFRVSEEIDASQISAECKDGVLTLHLPKVEAFKPRKITVNAK